MIRYIAHDEPDHAPAWFGSSVEFIAKATKEPALSEEEIRKRLGEDFRRVFPVYPHVQKITAHDDSAMMPIVKR
jgi:hypothetical protein